MFNEENEDKKGGKDYMGNNVNEQLNYWDILGELREATTTDEKVEIAKKLLLETNIIEDGRAIYLFDDEKLASEENYFKKLLEYKFKNKVNKGSYYSSDIDCDVNILCIVMYTLMNPKGKLNIKKQNESAHKYEILKDQKVYKGDTLTSAIYFIKLYLGCLWKEIDENKELQKIKKYRNFYNLFEEISNKGIPVAPTGNWGTYCYEKSDIIWKVMDNSVKNFLKNYNMFGNYMCIPGKTYEITDGNWGSFNTLRSNIGKWDTVDTLLAKIYGYYRSRDIYKSEDTSYLEAIFVCKNCEEKDKLIKDTKYWLDEFDSWKSFVEMNALQPFVDEKTLCPISMKSGDLIDTDEIEIRTYNPIPEDYKGFITFFKNVSEKIALRNKYIYGLISTEKVKEVQ